MTTTVPDQGLIQSVESGFGHDFAEADSDRSFGGRAPSRVRVQESQVTEAAKMLGAAFKSQYAMFKLQEAFASTDFQWAAWTVIEREIMDRYGELEPQWKQWVSSTTVRDFRPKKLVDFTQSRFSLVPVPELTEYPSQDRSGYRETQIAVSKLGRRYAISWEAIVNDQLNELADVPAAMSAAAGDAETLQAYRLLLNWDTTTNTGNGPNTNFFKNWTDTSSPWYGVNNSPAAVPLTLDNLDAAIQAVKLRTVGANYDAAKRPVAIPNFKLLIPSTLEITARRILGASEITVTTGNTQVKTANYLQGAVSIVVDPWLTYLNTNAKAGTTWFLVPEPTGNAQAFKLAFLRGHETPDLRVKEAAGRTLGGGQLAPEAGSFEIDDVQWRIRHVVGGATLDPIATYVSTGS